MRSLRIAVSLLFVGSSITPLAAQQKPAPDASAADSNGFAKLAGGLAFRSIGPALTSGRIADIAVHPRDKHVWYVATAAGGVWKSVNGGTSFNPIFDGEGSFSIGAITIDTKRPETIWVGTGEGNAQRVVAYGDGIYRSNDGGRSWKNLGLKESEHISRIVVDPRNSDVVYVAAQGPLWRKGGDRGIYKTTDAGKTWTRILQVDDWTGANDIQLDPRDPDVLLATTWQRERSTCCFVAGGPGSAVYRSTDAGKTWNKSQSGFPSEDIGRIGLSVSPADPRVVYAIVEAANGKGGFFRSRDFGASWEKMSEHQTGGNYYNRIFADPKHVDRIYSADVNLQVSEDGGKTFHRVGELLKHVDNHSVTFDPDDEDHLIVGCDGGVYETWDRGQSWRFIANLPLSQFYRVFVDDTKPFYRVFGGAQDNFSVGGPARTYNASGIRNSDWFITSGGDGFGSVVDPNDPDIVYAQSQFGVLSRFNLRTGDEMGIQPTDALNGPGFRWNWDSPLIPSAHANGRIYFANDRVLRSDDRGNTWKAVSPDLSRNIDRTSLRLMDRVWGVDAVGRNASTTLYGNMTALVESPLKETILATGTNDGRVSVTEDGGTRWRSIDKFATVPDTTMVSSVRLSQHDANTLYATFNNHMRGDFKPYVLKSTDLGRTWASISGNLPERGTAWTLAEDFVDRDLLFAGTDFGVYVTRDGGAHWSKLGSGLPTIQVRDIAIQKRESDLVLATFGRGFYVLDDYSPLRHLTRESMAASATLFPARTTYQYVERAPLGFPSGLTFQGAGQFFAANPPYGAVITYYLHDGLKSRKAQRQEADAAAEKKGGDAAFPPWDALKAEDREEEPTILLEVSDSAGHPVRRLTGPASAGMHRVAWDLRYQATDPVNSPPYALDPNFPFSAPPRAPWALPGRYTVKMYSRVDGAVRPLASPITITIVSADGNTRLASRNAATLATDLRNAELKRSVLGASALVGETIGNLKMLKRAIDETPNADSALIKRVRTVEQKLLDMRESLSGDPTLAIRNEHTPPSMLERLGKLSSAWSGTMEPATASQLAQVDIVRGEFGKILAQLQNLYENDFKGLQAAAERAGVPWTSGRMPTLPYVP